MTWHYLIDPNNCFYCVFNSPLKWSLHVNRLYLSSIIFSEHTESQFSLLLVQRMVVCPHRKLAIICNTQIIDKEGPWRVLCYFCISVVLLASRQLHQRSQPRRVFKWKLCILRSKCILKSCWRAWNALIWRWKTPKQEGFGPFWVWLTLLSFLSRQ